MHQLPESLQSHPSPGVPWLFEAGHQVWVISTVATVNHRRYDLLNERLKFASLRGFRWNHRWAR